MDRRISAKKMTPVQIDIAREAKRIVENLGTTNNLNPRGLRQSAQLEIVLEIVQEEHNLSPREEATSEALNQLTHNFKCRRGLNKCKDQIDAGKVDLTVLFVPECTERVRVTGFGISPMVYNSVQHSGVLVQSLQEDVKELLEEVVLVQGLKDEVASLRVQMAKLEKFMGNHIPSHPVKYKLFWLTPSNVVATGHWHNEEPICKVHNVPLGIGMLKVSIQIALKKDVSLARGNDHLKTIGDTWGSFVAWPTPFIIMEPDSTGLTTSPDNYGCILADDMGHSHKGDAFSCKTAGIHQTTKPSSGDSLNLKRVKWEGLSSQRAIIPVEDENPSLEFKQILVPIEEVDSKKYNRDLSFLPKPLSIANFSASNSNGTNVRVAYQGVPGPYSKAASLKAYPECEAIPCDQFEATFRAELTLCEKYLTKLGVVRESADDTAGAAQFIALNRLKDTRAVVSARATDIYGLKVLNDRPFKTSIFFTLEERPEVLFKALAVFAMRDINLTTIESRPQKKRPLRVIDDLNTGCAKYFDYLFYIDFEASIAEERAQNALIHLQEFVTFMRVLGCYPMDLIS
ncbi:hypothetical protein GIB67_027609 [Kingdonia uniflora]|uniref:arogenate dehydratase n=1 Tax=Kingdonia uniflora TaxID=39325 RepID=A0A7J7NKP8_9MAGN|nr:hypothetical protein GIB67_027609 [Kingdonia uniflora]